MKWTDEEVDMLHSAVRTFAEDLQTISETIKQRTVIQIKSALKKKVRQTPHEVNQRSTKDIFLVRRHTCHFDV